jgi:hypothetical protein
MITQRQEKRTEKPVWQEVPPRILPHGHARQNGRFDEKLMRTAEEGLARDVEKRPDAVSQPLETLVVTTPNRFSTQEKDVEKRQATAALGSA